MCQSDYESLSNYYANQIHIWNVLYFKAISKCKISGKLWHTVLLKFINVVFNTDYTPVNFKSMPKEQSNMYNIFIFFTNITIFKPKVNICFCLSLYCKVYKCNNTLYAFINRLCSMVKLSKYKHTNLYTYHTCFCTHDSFMCNICTMANISPGNVAFAIYHIIAVFYFVAKICHPWLNYIDTYRCVLDMPALARLLFYFANIMYQKSAIFSGDHICQALASFDNIDKWYIIYINLATLLIVVQCTYILYSSI